MSRAPFRQLTLEDVVGILDDYEPCPHCGNRNPPIAIAIKYDTSPTTVSRVLAGGHPLFGEAQDERTNRNVDSED